MTTVPLRPSIAAPLLPAEWLSAASGAMPRLARQIVAQIRAEIPEYAIDPTGEISAETRTSVQEALRMFMGTLTGGGELSNEQGEVFRRLGRMEAMAGRSHDTLQAAYRVASHAIMHQLLDWERQFRAPQKTIAELSSAIFTFIDELATLSAEGYAAAQADRADDARRRTRLLSLLLQRGSVPRKAVDEAAVRLGWPVPSSCSVVEVVSAVALQDAEATQFAASLFGEHALAGQASGRMLIIAPDPVDPDAVRDSLAGRTGLWVFVGPRMPLLEAATSARLARRAAGMVESRNLAHRGVLMCEEHLLELFSDTGQEVSRALRLRWLEPLEGLSPAKRLKYGRLLSAWLEFGTINATEPGVLDKHRQTLRYQTTRLEQMFGDALQDRSARLEMILALRATLPEWEREATQGARSRQAPRAAEFVLNARKSATSSSSGAKNSTEFQHVRNVPSEEGPAWLASASTSLNGEEP